MYQGRFQNGQDLRRSDDQVSRADSSEQSLDFIIVSSEKKRRIQSFAAIDIIKF